jgi:Methyltransferase domain
MDQIRTNFPTLKAANLFDAKLYADRKDMVSELGGFAKGGKIAEIGVALGDFSTFLLETLIPESFVGFDVFELHKLETLWGQGTKEIFHGMSHYDFFKHRLSQHGQAVVAEKGFSHDTLAKYPDGYFNLIYVDAEHTYEPVKRDAELAARKLVDGGLLIFNDYIMYDHFLNAQYGVVPVVNEMVVNQGWSVVGFALQPQMFCDIAIQRIAR